MDTIEAGRIEATNHERYQLATAHGWRFRPDAPDMLTRWQVLPFNQQGDQRIAFGAISGAYQGIPFTVFDFHRGLDVITIDTVWVVRLPAPMPLFQIVSSTDSNWDTEQYPQPPTPDRKFNRLYRMVDTDPSVALGILTPHVTTVMRKQKLHNWSLTGNDLIYAEQPIFGRVRPDDVIETLDALTALLSVLPQYRQPPPQQYPYPPRRY
jgi:hypothetical protein